MKAFIGISMVITGAILGLYVGVWLCFVGGIVDVIQTIRAPELIAMNVAIGIAKVVFSEIAGWISAAILVVPGMAITTSR